MAPTALCRSSSLNSSLEANHPSKQHEDVVNDQHPVKSVNPEKKKRFHVIESPFTTAVREDVAVRGLYSLVVAMMIIRFMMVAGEYYFMRQVFLKDMAFLRRSFSQIHWVLVLEAVMLAIVLFMLLPAVRLRVQGRINSVSFFAVVFISAVLITVIPLYIRFACDLHVVMAIAVIFEQVRYAMKVTSFIVENEPTKNEKTKEIPTIQSCLYFCFAPTLIYQHSYPRSGSRDWKNISCWCLEIVALIWSAMIVLNHGYLDVFADIGTREQTVEDWFLMLPQAAVLGTHAMIGISYGFLHCWSNIWAELLFFADRTFYKNFFASDNLYSMFSKWNYLIHSWITEYLFKPLLRRYHSKLYAVVIAFFVSMIFHDYVTSIPLNIYSLSHTCNLLLACLLLPFLLAANEFLDKHPIPSKLNVNMFFIGLLISTNIAMVLTMKYFTAINCPHAEIRFASLWYGMPDASVCW